MYFIKAVITESWERVETSIHSMDLIKIARHINAHEPRVPEYTSYTRRESTHF